jgi:hypothetical protein
MATPYTVGDTSPALTGTVSASLVTFSNGKVQTFYYDALGSYGHFTVRDQIA